MLYLDVTVPINMVNPKAQYHQCRITMGRRRHQYGPPFDLWVPPGLGPRLNAGFHLDLTLTGTKSEKGPHIVSKLEDRLYLILSSRLTTDPGFVGNIRVPRQQNTEIIARAKPYPNSGRWETLFIRAKVGESYYINWNQPDGTGAVTSFYYVAALDQVYTCPQFGIPSLFEMLGVKPSFTIRNDPDWHISRLDYREWRKL